MVRTLEDGDQESNVVLFAFEKDPADCHKARVKRWRLAVLRQETPPGR